VHVNPTPSLWLSIADDFRYDACSIHCTFNINFTMKFFERIKQLSPKAKLLFSVALCQRMRPNFVQYCVNNDQQSNLKIFDTCLITLWQHVYDAQFDVNYAVQLNKLDTIVPPEQSTDLLEQAAFDAVVGLTTIFHALESKVDGDLHNLSKLSTLTVQNHLLQAEPELTDADRDNHPMLQEEFTTQETLLTWCSDPIAIRKPQVQGLRAELLGNPSNLQVWIEPL
jgi:uncharacterized protein YjaG (DUF416 family)